MEQQKKLKTMSEEEEEVKGAGTGEAGTPLSARRACAAPHGRAGNAGPSLPVGHSCSAQEEEEEEAAQGFLLSFLASVLVALERPLASGSRSLCVGCY